MVERKGIQGGDPGGVEVSYWVRDGVKRANGMH